jgi:hypothetical protein
MIVCGYVLCLELGSLQREDAALGWTDRWMSRDGEVFGEEAARQKATASGNKGRGLGGGKKKMWEDVARSVRCEHLGKQ